MRIVETEGDRRSTPHLEQEEREFARCRAGQPRREVPADIKPSRRATRGEGVIVNAQMCR
jgi:hypothetical protein